MKHTTTRKKMLLSSVAMLLVAMLALSSATFAWFTQNTSVTAEGLTAKAASSVGIKILSKSEADTNDQKDINDITSYGYSTTLYTGQTKSKVLSPVSLNAADDMALFKTTADAATNYAATKTTTDVNDAVAADYFSENVYVALDGNTGEDAVSKTVKVTGLDVTTTSVAMSAGIRVALYYTTGGTTSFVGAYAPTKKASEKVFTSTGKIGTATESTYTFEAFSTVSAVEAGEINDTAGANFFTVLVYLDGEDSTVYSEKISASDLVSNVKLTFGI